MDNVEKVKAQLASHNLLERYLELPSSSATVTLAAQAIGCGEDLIIKTLSLKLKEGCIVIAVKGTARIDNQKFKQYFKQRPVFLKQEEVEELTGHPVGGVCPFALKQGVKIYLDISVKQAPYSYPAAGAKNNAVKLTPQELETVTGGIWIDVCK